MGCPAKKGSCIAKGSDSGSIVQSWWSNWLVELLDCRLGVVLR